MAIETERKFLVATDAFLPQATDSRHLVQGYLCLDPARTVRVRIAGQEAFLTVKGPSDPAGLSRGEWEYRIPLEDARQLVALCLEGVIDKTRYRVPVDSGRHIFTVDVFHGDNRGLVLAEIELDCAQEAFERPEWLGREVTGDARYYNAALSTRPYRDWGGEEDPGRK